MSGISGSGKTTYAGKLLPDLPVGWRVCVSADQYFLVGSYYKFDPSKLGLAHGDCFKRFIGCLQDNVNLVVVDNTNTTSEEIAPYILGAQAYGYEAEIITLHIPYMVAYGRNQHGVTAEGVEAQFNRLNARRLPPWWKNTDINVEGI